MVRSRIFLFVLVSQFFAFGVNKAQRDFDQGDSNCTLDVDYSNDANGNLVVCIDFYEGLSFVSFRCGYEWVTLNSNGGATTQCVTLGCCNEGPWFVNYQYNGSICQLTRNSPCCDDPLSLIHI